MGQIGIILNMVKLLKVKKLEKYYSRLMLPSNYGVIAYVGGRYVLKLCRLLEIVQGKKWRKGNSLFSSFLCYCLATVKNLEKKYFRIKIEEGKTMVKLLKVK